MAGTDLFGSDLTGTDVIHAKTFPQVAGTVRLLVFRVQNIDEYDNAGTRTNRGTGYNASTTAWNAAAWGDQIIAVNKLDATQSSTGAGFSALGGSSPKASRIAANLNFVMLADVDDSGSNVYSDMVWWCALQNPLDWVPSLATQAGRIRLLDTPGPIIALYAYRDMFVAFKANSMYVGRYQGPFIFEWTLVSNRVGCLGSKALCELDGKLYVAHHSGFYEFDGQNLRNIGLPCFQSYLSEVAVFTSLNGNVQGPPAGSTGTAAFTKAVADDVEGVVWFTLGMVVSPTSPRLLMYGYNARRGVWSRSFQGHVVAAQSTTAPIAVQTNFQEMNAFKADTGGRVWAIFNGSVGANTRLGSFRYPVSSSASYTTGLMGAFEQGSKTRRIFPRHVKGSDAVTTSNMSGTLTTYSTEDKTAAVSTATLSPNTELGSLDGLADGKFATAAVSYTTMKVILGGLTLEGLGSGKR